MNNLPPIFFPSKDTTWVKTLKNNPLELLSYKNRNKQAAVSQLIWDKYKHQNQKCISLPMQGTAEELTLIWLFI